jgi:hypothetical protein
VWTSVHAVPDRKGRLRWVVGHDPDDPGTSGTGETP